MMLAPAHFHPPVPPQPVAAAAATGPGSAMMVDQQQPPAALRFRKRKAEYKPENNERLSKRMSLLNLGTSLAPKSPPSPTTPLTPPPSPPEQSGAKLYVPVESQHPNPSLSPTAYRLPPPHASSPPSAPGGDNEMMALDDTKYKVYIRNLDDELTSSEDESCPEAADNLIINLPDIQKHLRDNRIPPSVLRSAPQPVALDKQLVLYRVPSSLTVPEEQDSVRKAILEARARLRGERVQEQQQQQVEEVDMDADDEGGLVCGPSPAVGEDPDAMELD